jgi:hypothetical protein
MQRIISLDFDGVLHPSPRRSKRRDLPVFCWLDCLARLLSEHPDVLLLVHSSWRETYRPDEIADMLTPLDGRFVGVAPPGLRGEAVLQWQRSHAPRSALLAIDDEDDEFPAHLNLLLVRCSPDSGLSGDGVQAEVEAWLKKTARDR